MTEDGDELRDQTPHEDNTEVSIVAIEGGERKVRLTVSLKGEAWKEVSSFLDSAGFGSSAEGLSALFEYGISERKGVDVDKRHGEMMAVSSRYSGLKFEAHTLFADNTALVISLPVTLPENRRLRRVAVEHGLLPIREEEWDSWDEDTISRFQRKYVFVQDSL